MEQDLRHVLEEKARMDNNEDSRQSPRLNIPLVVGAALIGGVTSLINTLPTPKPLPLLQNHPMCGVTTGGKVGEQSIILCSKQPAVLSAQEAHLSLRPFVRVYQRCAFKEPLQLCNLATFGNFWQHLATFGNFFASFGIF